MVEIRIIKLRNYTMKIQSNKSLTGIFGLVIALLLLVSCNELVEDGYTVEYGESDAELLVETIGFSSAAIGETISFRIEVNANKDIRSCVVQATKPGAGGSGYDVSTEGYDDPFADHNFGTIKKNVKSFVIKYDYVIPEEVNSSKITFTVVEQEAKVSKSAEINVVPGIVRYTNKKLYAKNNMNNDAFATIDGLVYPDIKSNYSTTSAENRSVQEKIDIVFYVDNGNSVISSPAHGGLRLELDIENQTKFKKLLNISHDDFGSITAASLVELTKKDSIGYYGSSAISGIKVGDIIGFTTDLNAVHALKNGLIKINQLHPTSIGRYEGTSYVVECDIVTQIEQ